MRDEVEAPAQVANRKAFGDGGHDAGLAQPLLADGAEDRLFGAEDGVDGPLGHSGLRGHDLDARRRITPFSEQRSRRVRDRTGRRARPPPRWRAAPHPAPATTVRAGCGTAGRVPSACRCRRGTRLALTSVMTGSTV